MKAVILAGGLGTRMRPYTYFLPKPLLPLADRPLLEHILLWLRENGIEEVILCVSYLRHMIEAYFRDGSEWGLKLTYVKSERPLGTAGQLKTAEPHLDGTFLCCYGDVLFKFPVKAAEQRHIRRRAIATIIGTNYTTRLPYGFLEVRRGRLVAWREKPEVSGIINTGCFIFEPKFLSYVPAGEVVGMDKAFAALLQAGERAFVDIYQAEYYDLGSKEGYRRAYAAYLEKLGELG
ncbi:MAG: nucleoside-diphosphate-sugar pyrophosphorylase [Nitrososphaerota archaeon]